MKSKKGFTLIELLAVIVILAIIALIAVPIVLNMINSARKSAAKSAALGYIDAIEYSNGFYAIGSDAGVSGYQKITSDNVSTINTKLESHLKGNKPDSGNVTVDSNGKVTSATLCINGYTVTYENNDVSNVTSGCSNSSQAVQTPWQPSTYFYTDSNHSVSTPTSDVSTLISNNEAFRGEASDESNNHGMWFKRNDQIYSLKAGDASYEQTHIQQIFSEQNESCVSDNDGVYCTSPNILSGYDITIKVFSSRENIMFLFTTEDYIVGTSYESNGDLIPVYQPIPK